MNAKELIPQSKTPKPFITQIIEMTEEIERLNTDMKRKDLMITKLNEEIFRLNKEEDKALAWYRDELVIKNMLIAKLEKDLEIV